MRWGWACLLFVAACGDAMVDGAYVGEPHLRVEGVFRGSTGEATIHSPHLGIIWPLHDGTYEFAGLDGRLTAIQADPLASTFSFEVWDLPPPLSLAPACDARIAMGVLAVFDDVNRDGRIDFTFDQEAIGVAAPDKALGMGAFSMLVYVDGALTEDCELSGLPYLSSGFHVLAFQDCGTWESLGAFVEVRLFPPADSFPEIDFEDESCFSET